MAGTWGADHLLTGKIQGIFRFWSPEGRLVAGIHLVFSGVSVEIPYSTEQGILKREQGNILLQQGISVEQQGSRFQFHSTGHPEHPGQVGA